MKEGPGGDHISVGVKLPSGVLQRPISNSDVYIKPPGKNLQLLVLLKRAEVLTVNVFRDHIFPRLNYLSEQLSWYR